MPKPLPNRSPGSTPTPDPGVVLAPLLFGRSLRAGFFPSPTAADRTGGPLLTSLICYCFGYSEDDIVRDFAVNGRSTILQKILSEKKAGACRCAETNPLGR